MKMSGVAHAVLGTIANGLFKATYAHQTIACIPACYKVRPLCYEVMNHSFDFWALYTTVSENDVQPDCVVCLERSPTCVAKKCGHILVCAKCFPTWCDTRALGDAVMKHSQDVGTLSRISKSVSDAKEKEKQLDRSTIEAEDDSPSDCVVCLERPPTFVFEKCGHLAICGKCRTWMCKERFNKLKTKKKCHLLI